MADNFSSDRSSNTSYVRPNLFMPTLPSQNVVDGEFAFIIQRALVPNDFKGIINAVPELGSVALKPYLDPIAARIDRPYLSNVSDIAVKNGDRVRISGNGNIQAWTATEGQWFEISDLGNKLKNLTPSILRATGYTIEGRAENLELNSVGSVWGGNANEENTLLFVCDGNKNWTVGGQMKLSDLFPATTPTTPITPTQTTVDTTPPRIVLLDEPEVDIKEGNLIVNIRTLLIDEGTSTTGGSASSTLPTMTFVRRTPSSVTTVGEEPVKIQLRVEEASASSTLPKISYSSRTPNSVTTIGETPVNIRMKIEE